MNIVIIGSFRKYYDEICLLIEDFESNGIKVLSPKKSFIVKELNGFVLLQSDHTSGNPHQIQQRVFENAEKSDFVYVWNPNGYIGITTAYEIGCIIEKGIPIYYKENVKDLPLDLSDDNIKSPEQIIELCLEKNLLLTYK